MVENNVEIMMEIGHLFVSWMYFMKVSVSSSPHTDLMFLFAIFSLFSEGFSVCLRVRVCHDLFLKLVAITLCHISF